MIAEIVSVGTELLLGQIIDTHAPNMARILAECGIGCYRRTTVGDNPDRLLEALREALERSDMVITIGGLGPTVDDLTRDMIAVALGDQLHRNTDYEKVLRRFFSSRSIGWTDSIARQADLPSSGRFIDNPNGTAPGLLCEKNGKVVIAMPGPKGEFDPMANGPVRTYLETLLGHAVIHSRVLRVCAMGESQVEDMIRPLMDAEHPTVAPYAQTGEVHLRLTAKAPTVAEADTLLDPVEAEIRQILGRHVFGIDDTTLEMATIQLLAERGETIAVAESMTGGELLGRLTQSPGASKVVKGGWVVYTVEAKENWLGISVEHGPVSSETAVNMAVAAREKSGSTWGIGITGNAGPTADVDGKPVGLTYIAVAGPDRVFVEEGRYRGQREDIRKRASQTALNMLRFEIVK